MDSLGGNVEQKSIGEITYNNAVDYGEEVVLNRNFPSVIDGLKPAQRAVLTSIYDHTYKKNNFVKSEALIGSAISNYHPHNPDVLYDTAVNLINQKTSLIQGQGAFSTRVSDTKGQRRYNNMKLSELGRELFSSVDYTEKIESYTGKLMPKELLPRFPYMLFSDSVNIAYGVGTTTLPFNAKEILEAMLKMVENPDISTEELMEIIKGPDLYPRHKIFMNKESLRSLIEEGNGLVTVICDIEVDREKDLIFIREVPWNEKSTKLNRSIVKLMNVDTKNEDELRKAIIGIKDGGIRNTSKDDNICIEIQVDTKKGYTVDEVVEQLYNKTNLKKVYNVELIFVDESGKKLDIFSVRQLIQNAIEVNKKVITKYYEDRLAELEQERIEYMALEFVTREENKEWFKEAIFRKDKKKICIEKGLTLEQADILFKGNNLNKLSDRDEIEERINGFDRRKVELEHKLTPDSINFETIEYIQKIMTLVPQERSSKIIYSDVNIVRPKVTVREQASRTYIALTSNGFIASSESGNFELPYKDKLSQVFEVLTSDDIYLLTPRFIFKVQAKEVSETFSHAITYAKSDYVAKDLVIRGAFVLDLYNDPDYVFLSNLGGIKRLKASTLEIKKSYSIGFELLPDEMIIGYFTTNDNMQIFESITRDGFLKRMILDNFSYKTKESKLAKTTKLDYGDSVVDFRLINSNNDNGEVTLLTKDGVVETYYNHLALKSPYVKGVKVKEEGIRCFLDGNFFYRSNYGILNIQNSEDPRYYFNVDNYKVYSSISQGF